MPTSSRGQGHRPPRWYKLCFSDTSADSSDDDSDRETINLQAHTSCSALSTEEQQLEPEPQSDWHFPPSSLPPQPPMLPDFPPLPPPIFPRQLPAPPLLPSTSFYPLQPPTPLPSSSNWEALLATYEALGSPRLPTTVDRTWPADEVSRVPVVPDEVLRNLRLRDIYDAYESDELSHCPICMEEFGVGDRVYMLPCNHIYCFMCILRWLETSPTCPVCRLELGSESFPRTVENLFAEEEEARVARLFRGYSPYPALEEPEDQISVIAGENNSEEAEEYESARDEPDDSNEGGGDDNSEEAEEYETARDEPDDSNEDGGDDNSEEAEEYERVRDEPDDSNEDGRDEGRTVASGRRIYPFSAINL